MAIEAPPGSGWSIAISGGGGGGRCIASAVPIGEDGVRIIAGAVGAGDGMEAGAGGVDDAAIGAGVAIAVL
jgi:hypothetical protein